MTDSASDFVVISLARLSFLDLRNLERRRSWVRCVTSSRSRHIASAEEGFAERYGLGVSEAEDRLGVAGTRGGVWFLSDCVGEDVPLGVVAVLFDLFVLVAALHAVGVGLLERVEDPMHPAVRIRVFSDSGAAGIGAGLGERIHAEVVVLERE